ncbi:MAG: hypothetical protein ACLQIB_52735 [Isosphaeraceae bacterium]
MTESKDLIEQLRRSNRRWKAVALTACFVLGLVALVGLVAATRQRLQVEAQMRAANEALVRAQMAANPAQPR